jgi:diguanylate cyclase (GGDEF)-like protein
VSRNANRNDVLAGQDPGAMALLCDALLVLDAQGSVTGVRAAAKSLQDLTRAEGCALPDLVFEEDRAAALEAAQRAREEGVGAECTAALALPGGSARYAAIRFVRGADGGSLLAAITDRTAEREKDETIARLRQHDALTGFYNRTYLPALLTQIDTKQSLPLLVIAVDINGMKLANDAFGYAEGDRLILEAATVLKVACPPQGAIARLGGDEFMMLVPRCDAKAGQYIIETITRMCEEEDDAMVPPSLSVGMAVKAHARQDIYSVIREAEEQLSSNRSLNSRRHRTRLIRRLMDYLAEKNFETGKHIVRVKGLALMLGGSLNLSEKELDDLSLAADMHDIGKVAIPERILGKKDPLTAKEWEIIRKHPETGYRVAYALPELIGVSTIVLHHHERWDGQGYPHGLSGEEIPLSSRIISVVDAYDNMINGPYRKTHMTREQALAEVTRCAGSQFDPVVAARFIDIMGRESD